MPPLLNAHLPRITAAVIQVKTKHKLKVETDELVNAVFVGVAERVHKADPEHPRFDAWVFTTARRLAFAEGMKLMGFWPSSVRVPGRKTPKQVWKRSREVSFTDYCPEINGRPYEGTL